MSVDGGRLSSWRANELRAMSVLAAESRSGRPSCVLVGGAPGMGKTRLLRELGESARRSGSTILSASGSGGPPTGGGQLPRQFATALARGNDDSTEDLVTAVLRLSEHSPLIIAVDDTDRLDAESASWLGDFLTRIRSHRVFVAATASCGKTGRALLASSTAMDVTVLPLGRLTEAQVTAAARAALGREAEAPLPEMLFGLCGGNPLLLDAALSALARQGASAPADARPGWDDLWDAFGIAVAHCLTRLSRKTRRVAEAMSVLGPGQSLERLSWLTGLPLPEIDQAISELRATGLVAHDVPIRFGHPVTAEAARRSGHPARLGELHSQAAQILFDQGADIEVVAGHLRQGPPAAADPWVTDTFREAARQAAKRQDLSSAVDYLRSSLARPLAVPDRVPVLTDLARRELADDPEAAVRHVREALRHTDDPDVWGRAVPVLTEAAVRTDQAAGVAEFLDTAAAALHDSVPAAAASATAHRLLLSGLGLPLSPETEAQVHKYAAVSAPSTPHRALLAALAVRELRSGANRQDAVALAERALADGPAATGSPLAAAEAYGVLLAADALRPDDPRLVRFGEDALRRGAVLAAGSALCHRAQVLLREGALPAAAADVDMALRHLPDSQWGRLRPLPLAVGSLVALETGDTGRARDLLSSVVDVPWRTGAWQWPLLLLARARTHTASGRHDAALADLDECLHIQEQQRWRDPESVPAGAWRPVVLAALGRTAQARTDAAAFLDRARSWGNPRLVGLALWSAGTVAGGEAGHRLISEAVQVLAATRARLDWVRAWVALGVAEAEIGQQHRARSTLRSACEAAAGMGAERLAEEAHDCLLRAGGRLRKPAAGGRAELSPSERRVTALAVHGATNREIAQQLYLSVRTVELHLSATYRKLGIRGRSQLPQALRADA